MKPFLFCSLLLLLGFALWAQPGHNTVLSAQMTAAAPESVAGTSTALTITLDIVDGLHINSHTPTQEFLIPTRVTFLAAEGIRFTEAVYPQPSLKKFSFSDEPLSIYEGAIEITCQAQIATDAAPGLRRLQALVSYQGCNDKSCFAPQEDTVQVELPVVAAGRSRSVGRNTPATPASSSAATTVSGEEAAAEQILQKGLPYALLAFFLVGLALNLTPCVYPVIPITVSYFAGQSNRSRSYSLLSALLYLLGIAFSFALLGLLSSLAGRQWGFLFASPWFIIIIASIILLMAASMFGAFEITAPTFLLTKFGSAREGVIGSLVMGLTVGVIIAPCAAGIIIGLVSLVARMGLVLKGALLFFAMGLGLGLPYLALAAFSGLLNRLPQSGEWMIWIKKLFGFMLIGVAFYFLAPQLERVDHKFLFLAGLTALLAGLLLGFLDHTGTDQGLFKWLKKAVGLVLLALGIVWSQQAIQAKTVSLPWNYYSGESMEEILSQGKPVFIDFYADWCAPCKQLDRETFNDSRVMAKSNAFYLLKVDCTKPDAATKAFMALQQVTGMPTLLFIKPDGQEITGLREIGFINAERFLAALDQAVQ
jgi:thioredoxin:protein disulfide reductase